MQTSTEMFLVIRYEYTSHREHVTKGTGPFYGQGAGMGACGCPGQTGPAAAAHSEQDHGLWPLAFRFSPVLSRKPRPLTGLLDAQTEDSPGN